MFYIASFRGKNTFMMPLSRMPGFDSSCQFFPSSWVGLHKAEIKVFVSGFIVKPPNFKRGFWVPAWCCRDYFSPSISGAGGVVQYSTGTGFFTACSYDLHRSRSVFVALSLWPTGTGSLSWGARITGTG